MKLGKINCCFVNPGFSGYRAVSPLQTWAWASMQSSREESTML